MRWTKRGVIYAPDSRMDWASNSALTPTPVLTRDDRLRIYAGFRDDAGVSRIGYVEVDPDDPSQVRKVSAKPSLDIGQDGAFDDNGVILGDILVEDDRLVMYYVGFQLVRKAKFLAFTGLAYSDDNGESFKRAFTAPVLDRSDEGLYFRAIHSVLYEDGVWKCWYGAGSQWSMINGAPYPSYNVYYIESSDGITFPRAGRVCFRMEGDEYRLGRPRVVKVNDKYRMYYTIGTLRGTYLPGYAESDDGINWVRVDEDLAITTSDAGWDSKSLSYTTPLRRGSKEYLFYNGNEMGRTGVGFAERQIEAEE